MSEQPQCELDSTTLFCLIVGGIVLLSVIVAALSLLGAI